LIVLKNLRQQLLPLHCINNFWFW